MAVSSEFRDHALDLLALVRGVTARAMFGGVGLFVDGAMFGLLDDDEIYLKADDESRAAFLDAGCPPWVYPSPKGPMEMGYYRPPDDAHDSAEGMLPWARLAVEAARRKLAAKGAKRGVVKKPAGNKPAVEKPAVKKPPAKKPPAGKKPRAGR